MREREYGVISRSLISRQEIKGLSSNHLRFRWAGERVVVRGKLTDFRKSNKLLILNMEDDLNLVIFPSKWEDFGLFGIIAEKYYIGQPVEVKGTVKIYKGKPEISISHPLSIRSLR